MPARNPPAHRSPPGQYGTTLVELLVGLSLGLLTIAVAMGSLMIARSVAGATGDASRMQQQAAHALRVLGQQLRQAGSLQLDLDAHNTASDGFIAAAAPVAFELPAGALDTLLGVDTSSGAELSLGYRNHLAAVYGATSAQYQLRNCLGQDASNSLIQSRFALHTATHALRCAGASGNAQPLIENVASFEVRYLLQSAPGGSPGIQYVNAAAVGGHWQRVVGVEICLVLYGSEALDLPAGSSYTDCNGASVDLHTLAAPRTRRAHLLWRNVFQLRSQGLPRQP